MKNGSRQGRRAVLLIISFTLLIRVARADDRARPGSPKPPRLLLVWHDAHRLHPGTHGGVSREVAALFAPLEVEVHWERAKGHDPQLDERTLLLRVVLTPSDPAGAGWELGRDVMGAVLPSQGRRRSIYIFYKTLVRGLKIRAQEGRPPDINERRLMEKALGRVVAHEMVHAVAPWVGHTKKGLMRSGVSRSFLASNDLSVTTPVRQAFYAGVESILSTTTASMAAVDPAVPQVVRHSAKEPPDRNGQVSRRANR